MKIKNLTGAIITLIGVDGQAAFFAPDGEVCWVREGYTPTGVVGIEPGDGRRIMVPMIERKSAGISNLPEPEPDTLYIVSKLVLPYAHGRPDVVALTDYVKDEKGRILGARGLCRNAE